MMKKVVGFFAATLISLNCYANAGNQNEQTNNASKQSAMQPKVEIKSFDWDGVIPGSRLVILKNHYGSIRSRNHSDERVYLHATYQLIGENALEPQFKTSEQGNRLVIEVVYAENIFDQKGNLRGRTDISILFPDDVSIYAETDAGLIKIDKTASHVEAVTNSGNIKLKTTGLFNAKTDSGLIDLKLRGQKSFGNSSAISKSGNINAEIFNDMDLSLMTNTRGKVVFDDVEQKPNFLFQQGNNKNKINFQSDFGNIKINVVQPPALVHSVKPSTSGTVDPVKVDVDLRDIKKAKLWKPGDPIFDRDDKKSNKKTKNRSKTNNKK